jgi:hypothetical protein
MWLDQVEEPKHNFALSSKPPLHGGTPMQGQNEELWRKYCELAVTEQDPQRLIELVVKINCLLEEKEKRLKKTREKPQS